ncbi:hypothetical protein SteCoe_16635 [Stentor coeruleus]|uniref:Uncharacterized protein n=1 Tax=Stentor coeruleus TaxID=5963 RepID=A0A1R2C0T6_9CILI|nr:hypothetical protein SteCoe_16635 [Stentor coeruleus]
MENKRIEDVERLLQKMRDENLMYKKNKENLYTKPLENQDDEEDINLPSRYREMEQVKEKKESVEKKHKSDKHTKKEGNTEDKPKDKLKKVLKKLKNHKKKLSTPKAKENKDKENLEIKHQSPKVKKVIRSATTKNLPYNKPSPIVKKKKNDTVALYQLREKEWKSNAFLKSNALTTREGRKLNLAAGNYIKDFEVKKKDVHEFIRNNFTAPHEKRRDDIRFQTRIKMMTTPEV